ncbi:hypothetical protein [Nocardia wallacei]|uniref:hypothetical protein n=1 Tax=Nocardia wallacei TaxID=480035 RepID=UPI002458A339|nr:hypothetical protein [Nocardia wallacei]
MIGLGMFAAGVITSLIPPGPGPDIPNRFAAGAALAITTALVVGLTCGFGTNSDERLILGHDERRAIHDDLNALLIRTFLFLAISVLVFVGVGIAIGGAIVDWLTGGLVCGILIPFFTGLVFGSMIDSQYGSCGGMTGGLFAGIAAEQYAIALLVFRITGDFPARPERFLNWACEAGLLRVTGMSYQFRHDTYQRWLAQRRRGATVDRQNAYGGNSGMA